METVEDDAHDHDGAFEQQGVEVEFLAVVVLEDEGDLEQQHQGVLDADELLGKVGPALEQGHSPGDVDRLREVYPEGLHEEDEGEQVHFRLEGQCEGPTYLVHQLWVVEECHDDGDVGCQSEDDSARFDHGAVW